MIRVLPASTLLSLHSLTPSLVEGFSKRRADSSGTSEERDGEREERESLNRANDATRIRARERAR